MVHNSKSRNCLPNIGHNTVYHYGNTEMNCQFFEVTYMRTGVVFFFSFGNNVILLKMYSRGREMCKLVLGETKSHEAEQSGNEEISGKYQT